MVSYSASLIGMLLAASVSPAVDFAVYRGFAFGGSVEASAKVAGAKMSNVRTVAERPAPLDTRAPHAQTRYVWAHCPPTDRLG